MSVLVREVDDESVIEWKVQTEEGEGTSVETLLLDRSPECLPYLTLTCKYGKVFKRNGWPGCNYRSIHLCLVQTEKSVEEHADALCSDGEALDFRPARYYKSMSISVTIAGVPGEKMLREETPHMKNWTCGKSEVTFRNNLLSFVFSIKFKIFGVSEMVEALKQMTDYFFLQQSHCDVQFCFPNDEQPIKGHVKILSSRSSVFSAMFQHDMQESKTGQVFIQDTERDIFYQLLHYIYSGRTWTSLTEGTAQKLLLAADKYNVNGLSLECTTFLISNIQWERAVDLMIWAHVHSIGQVKEAALEVVVKNGKQICPLAAWERLSINYPQLCLEATRRMMA